jgi:hypothetical protein
MLFRSIAGAVLALGLLTSGALAAVDFSHVRCEDPHFVKYMNSRLPSLRNMNSGKFLSQDAQVGGITSAHTVSASPDKLICEVRVSLTIAGRPLDWRGRFTTQLFPNHRVSWKWQPLY